MLKNVVFCDAKSNKAENCEFEKSVNKPTLALSPMRPKYGLNH